MPLRLAAPDDLDLRPLVWNLDRAPWSERVTLRLEPVGRVGALLAEGAVDVGLVPVQEVARRAEALEVVPGMSRAASGPDPAVVLVHARPLRELGRVAAPRRGHASELLLRVLFAESGSALEVVDGRGDLRRDLARHGGVLLHGDDALSLEAPEGARRFDLAAAWNELTGRPALWALWAARPGAVDRETYALLHTVRTRGRHDARLIAQRLGPARGVRPQRLLDALETRAMYRLGTPQLEGLARFWDAAAGRGWLPARVPLRFLPLSEGSACHAKAEVLRALRPPCRGGSGPAGAK